MKYYHTIIAGILLFVPYASGSSTYDRIHPRAQESFFPFLKNGYEARSCAMAKASVGMPNGLYGTLANPAALGFVHEMQALLSYVPIILDVRSGALAFAWPQERTGIWGVHIMYLSAGSFEDILYDKDGNKIDGSLNPYWVAGGVTWSRSIVESLAFGATVKGIVNRLSEGIGDDIPRSSADGFAVDIGVQYRTRSSRLIYGILVQNLGFIRSSYSDDIEKTNLPLSFITGISYVFKNFPSVRTAFDLEKPIDDFLQYKLGLELNIYKQMFILRGGYSFSQSDLEEFFAMIRNGKFDDEYQKTSWSLFSIGAGVKSDVKGLNLNCDAALNFRVDRMDPGFALSFLVGF